MCDDKLALRGYRKSPQWHLHGLLMLASGVHLRSVGTDHGTYREHKCNDHGMMAPMPAPLTGNPDRDFALEMSKHHQV